MATFYSDHYTATGVDQTSLPDPRVAVSAGKRHARVRMHNVYLDMSGSDPANADTARICTMKSSDRLLSLKIAADGNASAGSTMDVGLALTGDNNDGAVQDDDLFASALDIATGFAMTEQILEAGTITDEDIGKTLWELLALGAGSDTEDPVVDYDILATFDATGAAGGEMRFLIEYLAGA